MGNYNLQYYIGDRLVETIAYNKPKPLCLSIKNKLSGSSHKSGTFKLVIWK